MPAAACCCLLLPAAACWVVVIVVVVVVVVVVVLLRLLVSAAAYCCLLLPAAACWVVVIVVVVLEVGVGGYRTEKIATNAVSENPFPFRAPPCAAGVGGYPIMGSNKNLQTRHDLVRNLSGFEDSPRPMWNRRTSTAARWGWPRSILHGYFNPLVFWY